MNGELRILIVEDDAVLMSTIAHIVGVSHEVATASSISMALAQIEKARFDVVLLDKKLPDGSGSELIVPIHLHNPKCAVIVITGDHDLLSVSKAISKGADDYAIKSEQLAYDLLVRIPVAVRNAERRVLADSSTNCFAFPRPVAVSEISGEALKKLLQSLEKEYLVRALGMLQGNTFRLAEMLGISRSSLFRRFSDLGLSVRDVSLREATNSIQK